MNTFDPTSALPLLCAASMHAETSEPPFIDLSRLGSEVGMAISDDKGYLQICNPAFSQLLGLHVNTANHCGQQLGELPAKRFDYVQTDLEAALITTAATPSIVLTAPAGSSITLFVDSLRDGKRLILAISQAYGQADRTFQEFDCVDQLTGLGNRYGLCHCLENWQTHGLRASNLAVIAMDLDRFKGVTDILGQSIGDELLKLVAERVKRSTRAEDSIFRLDANEFVLLHHYDDNPSSPEIIAKRLVELNSRPFLVAGKQINIGASVGIAVLHEGTEIVSDLLSHARLALQDAIEAGRGTYAFTHPNCYTMR